MDYRDGRPTRFRGQRCTSKLILRRRRPDLTLTCLPLLDPRPGPSILGANAENGYAYREYLLYAPGKDNVEYSAPDLAFPL